MEANVKYVLEEGFIVPTIFSAYIPMPALLWLKSWSNQFGRVSAEGFFEWCLLIAQLEPQFAVFVNDTLGTPNNQSKEYRQEMVKWYLKNLTTDIISHLRRQNVLPGGPVLNYDKLATLCSLRLFVP